MTMAQVHEIRMKRLSIILERRYGRVKYMCWAIESWKRVRREYGLCGLDPQRLPN